MSDGEKRQTRAKRDADVEYRVEKTGESNNKTMKMRSKAFCLQNVEEDFYYNNGEYNVQYIA